jgi:hypothetical protein
MNEVPLIEPLVVKKIAHERLTALVFREECLVTACQDGYVCTWARPGKMVRSVYLFIFRSLSSLGRGRYTSLRLTIYLARVMEMSNAFTQLIELMIKNNWNKKLERLI